ncbi:hypothetical protein E5288_WYG011476 [Bos mutus]|uniref:Uncharacterized protein n=1 Tax=Bos mutus TaxID=72004 RepID=A0A6B0S7S4_9CETA|nr:hypothetical protein [Bos mutus]
MRQDETLTKDLVPVLHPRTSRTGEDEAKGGQERSAETRIRKPKLQEDVNIKANFENNGTVPDRGQDDQVFYSTSPCKSPCTLPQEAPRGSLPLCLGLATTTLTVRASDGNEGTGPNYTTDPLLSLCLLALHEFLHLLVGAGKDAEGLGANSTDLHSDAAGPKSPCPPQPGGDLTSSLGPQEPYDAWKDSPYFVAADTT